MTHCNTFLLLLLHFLAFLGVIFVMGMLLCVVRRFNCTFATCGDEILAKQGEQLSETNTYTKRDRPVCETKGKRYIMQSYSPRLRYLRPAPCSRTEGYVSG